MGFWARFRHSLAHRVSRCDWVCTCQIVGYLWYADGKVWSLSREDVEMITRGK